MSPHCPVITNQKHGHGIISLLGDKISTHLDHRLLTKVIKGEGGGGLLTDKEILPNTRQKNTASVLRVVEKCGKRLFYNPLG